MKSQKFAVILGVLASNVAIVSANDSIEIKLGKDWYYNWCDDSFVYIDAPHWNGFKTKPHDHAPKVPDGFTSRSEYVLRGFSFKPREFWEKPIEKQLVELKDAIWGCNLLPIVEKHHDGLALYAVHYSHAPHGEPYPDGLEEQFEKAVWQILYKKYDISLKDFTTSIRSMLIQEDRLYSAPLIVYFADKLAPRYAFYYRGINEWNKVLTKVVKLPSEFEVLTGTTDAGTIVYERK